MELGKLKAELSEQWNRPKLKNLRRDKDGKIIDKRLPRDYTRIKLIQDRINKAKGEINNL